MTHVPFEPTVGAALAWARQALAEVSTFASLDADVLLAHALGGIERATLRAHPERRLTPKQAGAYANQVRRRAGGLPAAYLIGRRAFYDLVLEVSPAVLIPRPESELLVEQALAWAAGRAGLLVVDVGTGSGALAVALARHLADARIVALDISQVALALARRNAQACGVADRIRLAQADLLAALAGPVDLIVANLPYIPSRELAELEVARHEPDLALDGGPDGLVLIRRLLADAPRVLAPVSLLLLEIGAGQGQSVRALAQAALPGADVSVIPDLAGLDRLARVALGA